MSDHRWVVHKFGGSSLADAECLRRVAAIVEALPDSRVALVLSACRGVTDELIRLVGVAERADEAGSRFRRREGLDSRLDGFLYEPAHVPADGKGVGFQLTKVSLEAGQLIRCRPPAGLQKSSLD